MGGGYSYLYIDLDGHGAKFSLNHYKIDFHKSDFSTHFEVEKHTIKFLGDYQTYSWLNRDRYYLYLRFDQTKDPFFTYYVSQADHVLKEVEIYYSKDHRTFPLIIGFVSSHGRQYYTLFYLTRIKSSYGFPPEHISSYEVSTKLIEEENICYRIRLIMAPHKKQNYRIQTFRTSSDFKTYKYIPKPRNINESFAVSTDVLFWLDRNIDYGFLYPFNLKYFDSITVYYSNANAALFVLLVNKSEKIGFCRKDKNGYWWHRIDGVDRDLDSKIKKALSEYQKNINLLFILDRKAGYNNVTVYGDDLSTKYYTIYNHDPSGKPSHSNPILLLNGDEIKLAQAKTYNKVDGITTYFLKNKDGLEDIAPFLIVLQEFISGIVQFTYYSKNNDEEKNWTKLPVSDEIDEVLKEIGWTTPNTESFTRLRNHAFTKLKNLKPQPTIQPDAESSRGLRLFSKAPSGVMLRSPSGLGGSFRSGQTNGEKQLPVPTKRPSPPVVNQPATELPPEPGPVERQQVRDNSQYERAHGQEDPTLHTAPASTPRKGQSPSRTSSIKTKKFSSAGVTSHPTSVKSGLSSRSPDLSDQLNSKVEHESRKSPSPAQKPQDIGAPPPLPPVSAPPTVPVPTGREPSPRRQTDLTGEIGTRSETSHTQDKGSSGERSDQKTGSSVERRPSDHPRSDSNSHLNPQSESGTGEDTKDSDESDDGISKNLKLAGAGVATTAIGAGAIGGGAHYAHGVLGVIHWLV